MNYEIYMKLGYIYLERIFCNWAPNICCLIMDTQHIVNVFVLRDDGYEKQRSWNFAVITRVYWQENSGKKIKKNIYINIVLRKKFIVIISYSNVFASYSIELIKKNTFSISTDRSCIFPFYKVSCSICNFHKLITCNARTVYVQLKLINILKEGILFWNARWNYDIVCSKVHMPGYWVII